MSGSGDRKVPGGRNVVWGVGAAGTFLIMAVLVGVMIRVTAPPDLTAARARERAQFLQEIRQAEAQLNAVGWQDKAKGLVRLPLDQAVRLMVAEWQDPAVARSNLIARVEVATAPPPAAPNPYE